MEPALNATPPAGMTGKTTVFMALGVVALLGATLAVYDLQRGIKQATALYSVGVAGLSVEGDLQSFTQQSRRTLIYALTTSDPNEQIPFVVQCRSSDVKVIQLLADFGSLNLDVQTRTTLWKVGQDWRRYQVIRDEIVSLILEGRPAEAMSLEQKDGGVQFEVCARTLQALKVHLDAYAQNQLALVQQTYYRSAIEIGMLVLMTLLFVGVLFKLNELRRKNTKLGEAELCERERNLVLQLVSEGKPLTEVLSAVQSLVERQYPETVCVVRLVSGNLLTFGCDNRLPPPYILAAQALPVDPPSCTCALAVAGQHAAFSAQIDIDPLWSRDKSDLVSSGVGSCLSVPIHAGNREVLGTIALFIPGQRHERGIMRADQFDLLERTARLAAVGIEQRLATDQLAFQASHDALTGLPNRAGLLEILTNRIASLRHREWAVIWVDLDRFKQINDSLGHQVGDMVLQAVAMRLKHCISEKDTAARIGGDEFVLVLDAADQEAASAVAARVVSVLADPFAILSQKLVISASLGVGRFPEHGASADELLRNADLAMYQAKRGGKNSFKVFNPDLAESASSQLEIDHLLKGALDNDEMWLVYQPQVSREGEVVGVEALLRWENPVLGIVPPTQFIPIAEENGSIHEIGSWVLRSACAQAALWNAEGHPIRMSVNVSASQLSRADFARNVSDILSETGLSPGFLELEITETSVMRDIEHCADQLRQLRKLGARIAIDDFGTGNSSLSYLLSLPVDTLKIDRSFIMKIDDGGMPIIRAILALAHGMDIETVAEGVEYEHQNRLLRAEGCDLIQGYYFFKPMRADALLSLLHHQFDAVAG